MGRFLTTCVRISALQIIRKHITYCEVIMADGIQIIYKGGSGEIVEKKSRFIATIRAVKTEEEAVSFIEEMKKKYWDARHNCSAFVIGEGNELQRCSDDGEPAKTAGRPMLDVLLAEGIHDAAVVVTRYFGGTLLGTGGLVRAYQAAVQEGLSNCVIIEKQKGIYMNIQTDYTDLGKIQYIQNELQIMQENIIYAENVLLQLVVPDTLITTFEKKVVEVTANGAKITKGDAVNFGIYERQIIKLT